MLLLLSTPLQAFAEALVWGEPGYVQVWAPGKGGGKGDNPTYPNYGYRITFTDSHQIDSSLTTLTGAYTKEDLVSQKSAVGARYAPNQKLYPGCMRRQISRKQYC